MKIKKAFTQKKIWFMSDLHYNHENIIHHSSRKFLNVEEMNSFIRNTLEKTLEEDDILFDLGDMFFKGDKDKVKELISSIPCPIYKIMGNHDYNLSNFSKLFKVLVDDLDIVIERNDKSYRLNLCHYPKLSWNHKSRGSIQLHGHCHGNIDKVNEDSLDLRVDVGFDSKLSKSKGLFLIEFNEILDYFYNKTKGVDFKEYVTNNYEIIL